MIPSHTSSSRHAWLTDAELGAALQRHAPEPEPLPDLLLRTGAMSGPYRPTRPLTVSTWRRWVLAVRAWLMNRKGPAL